ncbi:MAG: hypothetical protein KGR23_08090 [Betaproteobacteria bacterium]|nr:hypothetical protein [Betaproteobacteria bacterium]
MMRGQAFVGTVLGSMLGLAPLPSMAQLCTAQIDQWTGKCVGGCSGSYAYKATCHGCNTCVLCGGCIALGPQDATAGKATDAQSLPVVLATGEMLAIPDAEIRRIAAANPWIAASIIALRDMGSNAVLAVGDAHFSRGPTAASIDAQPTKGRGDEEGLDPMKRIPAGQPLRLRSWNVSE